MNPREMTLEQMQERETASLKVRKDKRKKAIAKLEERLANETDVAKIERLKKVIATHKDDQTKLNKTKANDLALLRYNKFQERVKPPIK